jgi:MFS family permease
MSARRPFVVVVLLPFAAAYYLSYVFRTINALIAGTLTRELALSAADLGLLTSVYFLAMAAVQLPLGVLLDRYGPRRVQSACLLFAAVGAAVFACAEGLPDLMLGRALIGVGVATVLMSSLKAIVLWFPKERIAFANGWVVMLGALGAVTATLPAEPLVNEFGWRGLFALLAAATTLAAAIMFLVVPEPATRSTPSPLARVRLRDIYRDMRFLRLAPLSTLCIGNAWSLQGLWAAPWLEHVEGLGRGGVVQRLLVMGFALSAGAMLLGWSADRLRRHGIGREAYYAVIAFLFITAQMMLVLRVPVPSFIPWGIIAAVGAATVLSFAMLPEYFPKEMSGRANAALNILHLGGAFALQYVTGVIVSWWPPVSGHPPAEAYEAAFGLSVVVQLLALLWFLCSARWATIPRFSPTCRQPRMQPALAPLQHTRGRRYATAGLAIAHHIAGARTQAAHWRLIGIGSATLCACLATLVALSPRSDTVVVHVVEAPSFVTADDDTRAQDATLLVASVTYRGGSDTR